MRGFIGRLGWRSGLLIVAALALTGGIAYATIPNSAGVYTACKLNSTGTIRLIDTSLPSSNVLGHCTSLETQISWNEQGQAGPQGPAGPAGAQGPAGANGKDGAAGTSVTSAAESKGANCSNGGSSFTAANGVTYACNGADGAKGADGAPGQDGAPGNAGSPGQNGVSVTSSSLAAGDDPNCANGGSKFTSASGVTYACNGSDGATGARGPAGPAGPAGTSGVDAGMVSLPPGAASSFDRIYTAPDGTTISLGCVQASSGGLIARISVTAPFTTSTTDVTFFQNVDGSVFSPSGGAGTWLTLLSNVNEAGRWFTQMTKSGVTTTLDGSVQYPGGAACVVQWQATSA